jgi:heat-inducible transcriptional repressor
LLSQTSQLLAGVTAHAAVVVGPQADAVVVRGAHLTQLQPRVLLAVVILSNGAVEKEVVVVDEDVSEEDVAGASAQLARRLDGRRLGDLPPNVEPAPPDLPSRLVRQSCDALRAHLELHQREPLYVGGASRLAAEQAAFTATTVAHVFELLEQHVVLASVMRDLLGPGLTVRIGAENERADLLECSLVLAPYLVEGELQGTIGVLGPTRMDYRKAQAAVATVSRQLGRQLSR